MKDFRRPHEWVKAAPVQIGIEFVEQRRCKVCQTLDSWPLAERSCGSTGDYVRTTNDSSTSAFAATLHVVEKGERFRTKRAPADGVPLQFESLGDIQIFGQGRHPRKT